MSKTLVLCQNIGSTTILNYLCTQLNAENMDYDLGFPGRSDFIFEELIKRFQHLSKKINKIAVPKDYPPLKSPPVKEKLKKILAYQNYKAGLEYTAEIRPRAKLYLKNNKLPSFLSFSINSSQDLFAHENTWPLHEIVARNLSYYSDFLKKNNYTHIVTCADGVNGPIELLSMAEILGIQIIMLPYGFPLMVDLEISLKEKKENGKLITFKEKYGDLVEEKHTHWIKRGQNPGSLMFSPEYISILESFGLSLSNPWMISGNLADVLCCEGEENKNHYLEEGLSKDKIEVTGTPYGDIIFNVLSNHVTLKKSFEESSPLDKSKTYLLVSWPTSYHDKYNDKNEFKSYSEMTYHFFKDLVGIQGLEVLVSSHPAMSAEEVDIIKSTGAKLSHDNLIELIPQHDIFCSFFSSTTRWALACGKLVANYDMYDLGLNIYDNAPGFFNSNKKSDIVEFLKKISDSYEERHKLLIQQGSNKAQWTKIDGEATKRIIDLLR